MKQRMVIREQYLMRLHEGKDDTDIVDDPEKIVGFESLGHFGEYDDDAVYVRNDRLKCDYEILRDPRRYEEAL